LETSRLDRSGVFVAGVRSDDISPEPLQISGLPATATVRVLSSSSAGASSSIVEAPKGWTAGSGAFTTLTEIFVLDGDLLVDGRFLERYHYVRCPAGAFLQTFETGNDGARFLLFTNAPVAYSTDYRSEEFLSFVALDDVSWKPATTPMVPPGLLTKRLAEDPDTGARTWVIGLVHWGGDISRWESHPCDEEVFFLEGEMSNGEVFPSGPVMIDYKAGGYFYRPAGIAHSGPGSGTTSYALALCRSSSTLTVDWFDHPPPFPKDLEAWDFGRG